jgi:hypothetical protein
MSGALFVHAAATKRADFIVRANQSRIQDELQRMEKAGFKAIFLTVDNTGVNGIRDRSLRFTGVESDTGHSATFDVSTPCARAPLLAPHLTSPLGPSSPRSPRSAT